MQGAANYQGAAIYRGAMGLQAALEGGVPEPHDSPLLLMISTPFLPLLLAAGALLGCSEALAFQQPPEGGTRPEAATQEPRPAVDGDTLVGEEAVRSLEAQIQKQLGGARHRVLRSIVTELQLVDNRQDRNLDGRLRLAFRKGVTEGQDALKVRAIGTTSEVETTRFGARYSFSDAAHPDPRPMTEATFQEDKAKLRRYTKMCRTLLTVITMGGLARRLEELKVHRDVEVPWFDGLSRHFEIVAHGLSTEIGGLLSEGAKTEAEFDPFAQEGVDARERAEVYLYFHDGRIERIDVRRHDPERPEPWQSYRFTEFERAPLQDRSYVQVPRRLDVYEVLPTRTQKVETALTVRIVQLRLDPTIDDAFFQRRGF